MTEPVIGVVGGSGGVGASTFAAAVAAAAGRAVLVDIDVAGGGIDVLLGIEDVAGARWSGLRVGRGHLDPDLLADGLPRWGSVSVLAADNAPPVDAVGQVLHAAAALGPVVVDLGRAESALRTAAVERCALVLVIAVADVPGLIAARAATAGLCGAPTGLVVRGGSVSPAESAARTGIPLVGTMPVLPVSRDPGFDPRRPPRALARVASGVLEAMATLRDTADRERLPAVIGALT
jgi:hypothetical protein